MISLYRPASSWLHNHRAGHKLLALCFVSIFIFPLTSLALLLSLLMLCASMYLSLGKDGLAEMRVVVPLWPWFLMMLAFHWYSGEPVAGLVAVVKMVLMILLANLLTLSTRQSDLLSALQQGLTPITWLGFSTRPLALSVSLMIRYIPVLVLLLGQHRQAWRARGGAERRKWLLVVPALIGALRLADHVGESLTARGGVSGFR